MKGKPPMKDHKHMMPGGHMMKDKDMPMKKMPKGMPPKKMPMKKGK